MTSAENLKILEEKEKEAREKAQLKEEKARRREEKKREKTAIQEESKLYFNMTLLKLHHSQFVISYNI